MPCSNDAQGGIAILRLRKFRISGFKALAQTTFLFPGQTLVLIGGNGSGKSSTLQALALVREFARGDATKFLDDRAWDYGGVRSQLEARATFRADLLFETENDDRLLWQFDWGLRTAKNQREVVWHLPANAPKPTQRLDHNRTKTTFHLHGRPRFEGLLLPGSVLPRVKLPAADDLGEISTWVQNITSLELLSPTAMRQGARGDTHDIGTKGERLASFLGHLDPRSKSNIVARLRRFYPIQNINTVRKRAGWVDVKIAEAFSGLRGITPTHASDGLLRLMALCAIPEFHQETSLVMLDEIEDSIEPHILPELIEAIVKDSASQFIFTSHSPLFVNFVKPRDIRILTRQGAGAVVASRFSEMESWTDGLEFLGPGELWSMTEKDAIQKGLAKRSRLPSRLNYKELNRFSPEDAHAFMTESDPE